MIDVCLLFWLEIYISHQILHMLYFAQQKQTIPIVSGGRHEKNIGGALWSDDDVTKAMTSLLLLFLAKILGGARAPPAPPGGDPPGVNWLRPLPHPDLTSWFLAEPLMRERSTNFTNRYSGSRTETSSPSSLSATSQTWSSREWYVILWIPLGAIHKVRTQKGGWESSSQRVWKSTG